MTFQDMLLYAILTPLDNLSLVGKLADNALGRIRVPLSPSGDVRFIDLRDM